ncbi:Ubiquitin_carboxyl-terminal hydrolase family protein [Hexamita inflata]|uniref:Ubiquitin carboxyl-terminal hydrolase family protein n=1 Tax=Hexamita inflata TaxID=28002 RepID=A0AA86RP51_9EUKA|nr:Ubiquitin carboxyl-terminal hydrolase family protein [Hexamita inflata]
MHDLKSIEQSLQKIVSEYKFEIKKPPESNFNTFVTKVNPHLQKIIQNYQPPKMNGEKTLNGQNEPTPNQKEADERRKKGEENALNKNKQDELNQLRGKFNSLEEKFKLNQTKLEKTISTKVNDITRKQNELKKNIIQQQKKLGNSKKEELEKDQEKLLKIKKEFKKTLAIIEEVQQILREHRGLDLLNENKNTSMLNALLQAIYNTEAGYNAILRGPNDKEVIERIEQADEHEPITQDDQSVVSAVQLIFLRMIYSKKQSISTVKFCKALGIDIGKQEDANELMKNLLEKLERASKAHDTKNIFEHTLQVYKETFEGQTGSTVRCLQCQNESLIQKPQTDLMMPVEEDFFSCFAAMLKLQDVDYKCEKCKKETKALSYSHVQSVPDLLCITLQRFHNKDNKQARFPIFLDLEFIKNCNLGEIGSNSTVTEMAQLFKMVMMPWLFFEVEPRKIAVKEEAAKSLLISEPFVKHLKTHYQKVTCEDLFQDSEDELLKIPEFTNTPFNLYTLRTIVRQKNDRFHTIALVRPNMVDRFQILKFDNQFVTKMDKKADEISAGENCQFFYEKVRNYEHGSSYNLSNFVQNRITEENRK